MKNGRTLTLNDKGILLIGVIILSLAFMLGWMTSRKQEDGTVFSRRDLEKIAQLQEIEDQSGSGAEICAYKDKDGNLMITYEYDDGRKRK